MHTISFATPDELKLEIDLGKNAEGQPHYRHDDAGNIMLLYSQCVRANPTSSLQEIYEAFRVEVNRLWNANLNSSQVYLIIETVVKIVGDFKKKHISDTNSKSSESTPAT